MRKIHKEQNFNSNRRGLYVNMLPISLPLTLPPLPFSNHRHITGFLLMKSSYILFSPSQYLFVYLQISIQSEHTVQC